MVIDRRLLDKQIKALLESNLDEETKSGLHNLLGEILDNSYYNEKVAKEIMKTIQRHLEGLKKAVEKFEKE